MLRALIGIAMLLQSPLGNASTAVSFIAGTNKDGRAIFSGYKAIDEFGRCDRNSFLDHGVNRW